jgi:hypothetical protein
VEEDQARTLSRDADRRLGGGRRDGHAEVISIAAWTETSPCLCLPAPEIENPRVSDTWNWVVIGPRVVVGLGENFTPSITSRSGRLTCETWTAAPRCVDSQER